MQVVLAADNALDDGHPCRGLLRDHIRSHVRSRDPLLGREPKQRVFRPAYRQLLTTAFYSSLSSFPPLAGWGLCLISHLFGSARQGLVPRNLHELQPLPGLISRQGAFAGRAIAEAEVVGHKRPLLEGPADRPGGGEERVDKVNGSAHGASLFCTVT